MVEQGSQRRGGDVESKAVLDETLLSLLACPQDKGPLLLVEPADGDPLLYNPRLRRAYPIENGIPVLLIDEAHDVTDDAEHERYLAVGRPGRSED